MMAQARKTRMDKSPNFRVALEVTTIKIFRRKTVTLLTRTPSNHLMRRAARLGLACDVRSEQFGQVCGGEERSQLRTPSFCSSNFPRSVARTWQRAISWPADLVIKGRRPEPTPSGNRDIVEQAAGVAQWSERAVYPKVGGSNPFPPPHSDRAPDTQGRRHGPCWGGGELCKGTSREPK
jgi:hypothetical protein